MIIRHFLLFPTICSLLSSCQVYQSNFDCPPGEGIPCASVSDIEKMIIECEEGPDFILEKSTETQECSDHSKGECDHRKRVWVPEKDTPNGDHILSHYIILNGLLLE